MSDLCFGVCCPMDTICIIMEYACVDKETFKSMRNVSKAWEENLMKVGMKFYKKQKFIKERLQMNMSVNSFVISKMVDAFRNPDPYQYHIMMLEGHEDKVGTIERKDLLWGLMGNFKMNIPKNHNLNRPATSLEWLQWIFYDIFIRPSTPYQYEDESLYSDIELFFKKDLTQDVIICSKYGPYGTQFTTQFTSFKKILSEFGMDQQLLWLYSFFDKAIQHQKIVL